MKERESEEEEAVDEKRRKREEKWKGLNVIERE